MEVVGVVANVKHEGAGSPGEPVDYELSSRVPDRHCLHADVSDSMRIGIGNELNDHDLVVEYLQDVS